MASRSDRHRTRQGLLCADKKAGCLYPAQCLTVAASMFLPICVGKYITDLLDGRNDIDNSMVFISSCQPKPGCMEAIKAGLRKYGKFENIIETGIGTTIGGYSGPGTIGIVFAKKSEQNSTKTALPCGEFHGRAAF